MRVWRSVREAGSEKLYDELIGEPHIHQWHTAGITSEHGCLWGYGSIGCGGGDGRTTMVPALLDAIRLKASTLTPAQRRVIFHRVLTKCHDEYEAYIYFNDELMNLPGAH